MVSLYVDKIINDTVLNFGGRESLVSRAANMSQLMVNTSQLPPDEQLSKLDTMMQDVEIGQKERIFWILLFSLMVFVAAGGNIVVIYIVSTNKEMKSVTNYFLVNLSLADTMVSTLNVIFNFISMLNSHWPFGNIYCKISNFIAILSISASVFTLTAISCDRYTAIIHPLRPRMSHRHAVGWILLIWTLSSALALPNLIYSVVVEDRLLNDNLALTCTMIWPDGRYPLSSYDHIYNIVIMVVTYLVPILTMAILYYKVGKELWGHQAIGEDVEKQARAVMAKKKIVKMMIVVVTIFALCWLPYHGFFVVNYYLPTIFQDGPLYYQRCYLILYWLAMSNSMYNPIIIFFMNSKFRHEFERVLYLICCCQVYAATNKSDGTNQNHFFASGNMHSAARLVNSIHAASKRLSGNGKHRASNAAALPADFRSGDTTPRQASTSGDKRAANQQKHQYNGSIEVVITQSNESKDSQQGVCRLDSESEPFMRGDARLAGLANSSDGAKNSIASEDGSKTEPESSRFLNNSMASMENTPSKSVADERRRAGGQEKVWI